MIKYISSFILLLLFSCAAQKVQQGPLKEFIVENKLIKYEDNQKKLETFQLDQFNDLHFNQQATPIKVINILKENQQLPKNIENSIISKVIQIGTIDRYILKIRHEKNSQFILPFITNEQNVQLPIKLMYEKNLEQNGFREKNFLIKIPQTGKYTLHFISFASLKDNFKSSFYFGHEQTTRTNTTPTSCEANLAFNLRHCINTTCRVDMTQAFAPLDAPPEKIFYSYQIQNLQNKCSIKVESNIEDTKTCQIPIEFNPLIQDCGYPLKDSQFARKLNLLHQKFFNAENPSDLVENSSLLQKLWLNEYPVSLMCSKELDFQLPDLDLLMKKYCKTTPSAKENTAMLQWREELEAKIAIRHATLNFKSLTQAREQNPNAHNELIEESLTTKNLLDECLLKNIIATCKQLSDEFSKIDDHEQAAKVSIHACNLGHALSCQKAGLSFTQSKKREEAQKYEIRGCNLKDSISCYNVACGYCVSGKTDLALKYFKKHLQLGAEDPMHIIFDPTIQCINKTTEYKQFLKKTLAP
jgi:hypothetical protein